MNVVGQKQQFFSVLSEQVTVAIRVDLASGAEKLLASDACQTADRYFLAAGNFHAQTAVACSICNNRPRRAD